ncbi:MAG: hypothetical protein C0402_16120 [Thermodesulfovibrio sp.]|nr:hypothetical protein [Thermodesulfovibrio sp.]
MEKQSIMNQYLTVRKCRGGYSGITTFLVLTLFFLVALSVQANAAITKTAAYQSGAPYPGSTVVYTINYSFDSGTDPLTTELDATLVDVVPSSLSLVTRVNDSNFTTSTWGASTLTWLRATPFALGAYSGTVTYTATINSNVTPGTVITNPVCLNVTTIEAAPPVPNVAPAAVLPPECTTAQFTVVAAPATPVPTVSEWGRILFVLLAGLGSIYFLRRQAAR